MNIVFSNLVKHADNIVYRNLKVTDPTLSLSECAGFSLYAIAQGSCLFQRLLRKSPSLSNLTGITKYMPQFFEEFITLNERLESCATSSTDVIETILKSVCGATPRSEWKTVSNLLPMIYIVACCSVASKSIDCTSTTDQCTTARMMGKIFPRSQAVKYAMELEMSVLTVLDWNVNPQIENESFDTINMLADLSSKCKNHFSCSLACNEILDST